MIGIVGLGKMGRPIAERLNETGQSLLVWNRTKDRAVGLADAEIAASPADVASRSSLVLSMMANDAAIEAVYFGDEGLLAHPLAGTVIVEMCTTSPEKARALEGAVTDAGGRFLECPVGGTIGPARKGELLGLAGGSAETFEAARPVLDLITRRLEYLGPAGSGAAMKLAINLPLMVYWCALGEALGLVLDRGIDPTEALDIMADSSGAIGAAKMRVPPIKRMLVEGDPGSANFALATGLKDMRLMEALADENGLRHEVISAARARAEAALDAGFAELDCSMLAAFDQSEKTD